MYVFMVNLVGCLDKDLLEQEGFWEREENGEKCLYFNIFDK